MRSSWEIKYAKYLDDNKFTWDYEPKKFILIDKTYSPDFYVKELKSYIEIKGWMNERSKKIMIEFNNLYPNDKLILLQKNDLIKMKVL